MIRRARGFAALVVATLLISGFLPLMAAAAPAELHGHSDSFAGSGVAIAWGVLRGTTEENTVIVLRVAADPAVYSRLSAEGVDPFTQRRLPVAAERLMAGPVDVRIPRARFADYPRTELRFYAAGATSSGPPAAPALVVFYLGVPDTTPEFTSEANLDASLAERIARLRATRSKP